MAGSAKDAGEEVPCPSCATPVLRKQMIPVLAPDGGDRPAYVCVQCARAQVATAAEAAGAATSAAATAD